VNLIRLDLESFDCQKSRFPAVKTLLYIYLESSRLILVLFFLLQLDLDFAFHGRYVLNFDSIIDCLVIQLYFFIKAEVAKCTFEVYVHHEFGSFGTTDGKQTK